MPLPSRALSTLVGELKSYNEVCEALSTVEVALGFLAMTGGEPHMELGSYLEEVLQMGDQTAPHILTVSLVGLHCQVVSNRRRSFIIARARVTFSL